MELWNAILAKPLVLLIPLISGVLGWGTNLIAVKMMLYPTNFVGIPPYLGWRGIVPAQALRLVDLSVSVITDNLFTLKELFASFSKDAFAHEIGPIADELTERIIEEVALTRAPTMWANAGEVMQGMVRAKVREEVVALVGAIAEDLSSNIEDLIDLREIALAAVGEDPSLMSDLFLEVGSDEFKFVERSGLWFGLLFGIVQMFVWLAYPAWWVLPLAGFFVGYATNWLALRLIFEPREPIQIGSFTLQGLFHKRKDEVAEGFAKVATDQVLSADKIVDMMQREAGQKRIAEIVQTHALALLEKYETHPMASFVLPERDRLELRGDVLQRIETELPASGGFLHTFASKAVDMKGTIIEKMKLLDAESFEGVLRPAFQADEWKLVALGAVLGLGAGILQVVYIFGETIL